MDPAKEIEYSMVARQKPMNDVLDRGDSDVQQFYAGATIFMTGGSGFIGKQLIEKLLRSCAIEKMYLLMRPKKNRSIQERVSYMFKNPVYDNLRQKMPNFEQKIFCVEGNVADLKLGLSEENWNKLSEEVNIIIHAAATIRFDEPLRKATLINIRSTREVIELAKSCKNLKKYIHVSTAFSFATADRNGKEIEEQFYPCPIPPETMIALAEEIDETRLNDITKGLIEGWPNTYTFSKSIAEELIRTKCGDLPVCVVRPPLVLPAYCEPAPGWLDEAAVIGPSGIYLGAGLGVLRVFRTDVESNLCMAPVDYVNNAIIAAGWDSTERQKNGEIPIYAMSKHLRYGFVGETMRKFPKRLTSPKSIWRAEQFQVKNKLLYFLLSWFYLYIPAYILDFICYVIGKKPKEIPGSFVELYRKVDKLAEVYDYFITNVYIFKQDNLKKMISRMNATDKLIYNCNLDDIDLENYILVWGIGLRKYIVKDGLQGTDKGYRKFVIFTLLDYIIQGLYIYALWWIATSIYCFVKYMVF